VEKAASAIVSLADGVVGLVKFFGYLTEKIGGSGVAIAALAPVILALTGPLGAVAVAAVAMGAAIGTAVDRVVNSAERAQLQLLKLHNQAQALRAKDDEKARAEQVAESDSAEAASARDRRAQVAVDQWAKKEIGRRGLKEGSKEALAVHRRQYAMKEELLTGRLSSGTDFDQRIANFETALNGRDTTTRNNEGGVVGLAEARAEAKAAKDAARRKGRGHEATKMDRQLAAIDPALASVLRRGGDIDEGGDLKVHDDVLSRGAFGKATAAKGLGSIGGWSGGLGPGPNIQTTNIFNNITVNQAIDARGQDRPAAESVAAAAGRSGQMIGGVVFTGVERLLAAKNSGGRLG
jgi:hypothetical protein